MVLTRKRAAGSPISSNSSEISGSALQPASQSESMQTTQSAEILSNTPSTSTNKSETSVPSSTENIPTGLSLRVTSNSLNCSTDAETGRSLAITDLTGSNVGFVSSTDGNVQETSAGAANCLSEWGGVGEGSLQSAMGQTSAADSTQTAKAENATVFAGTTNPDVSAGSLLSDARTAQDNIQVTETKTFSSSSTHFETMPGSSPNPKSSISGVPSSSLSLISSPTAVGEDELHSSGNVSTPQQQTQSASPGQHSAVRYRLVYNNLGTSAVHTVQHPSTPASVHLGLTSLFTSKTQPSSQPTQASSNISTATASNPSTLTIVSPQNKNAGPQQILLPVPQTSQVQPRFVGSHSNVRSASKQISLLNSSNSVSLLGSTGSGLTAVNLNNLGDSTVLSKTPSSVSSALNPSQLLSSHSLLANLNLPVKLVSGASITVTPPNRDSQVSLITPTVTSPSTASAGSSAFQDMLAAASAVQESPGSVSTKAEEMEPSMMWDKSSTLMLIRLYKEHKAYFESKHYKKKSVWENIAAKLRQGRRNSQRFGWNHVENKWKNMTKKYRDCVDMNRRNGTNHQIRYHDEIAAVYHYNPDGEHKTSGEKSTSGHTLESEQPMVLSLDTAFHDGLALPTKRERLSPSDEMIDNSASDGHEFLVKKKKYLKQNQPTPTVQVQPKPILPRPPPPQPQESSESNSTDSEITTLLRQLREDRQQQEKSRMDRLEAMHREKMNMFGKFLDFLKQSKPS